jgi:hypothetical protein
MGCDLSAFFSTSTDPAVSVTKNDLAVIVLASVAKLQIKNNKKTIDRITISIIFY